MQWKHSRQNVSSKFVSLLRCTVEENNMIEGKFEAWTQIWMKFSTQPFSSSFLARHETHSQNVIYISGHTWHVAKILLTINRLIRWFYMQKKISIIKDWIVCPTFFETRICKRSQDLPSISCQCKSNERWEAWAWNENIILRMQLKIFNPHDFALHMKEKTPHPFCLIFWPT